jgi:hypothetical protein
LNVGIEPKQAGILPNENVLRYITVLVAYDRSFPPREDFSSMCGTMHTINLRIAYRIDTHAICLGTYKVMNDKKLKFDHSSPDCGSKHGPHSEQGPDQTP